MSRPVVHDHFLKIFSAALPHLSDDDLESINGCFSEEVGNATGALLSMVGDLGGLAISDEFHDGGTGTFSNPQDVSGILFAVANSLEYIHTLNSVNGGVRGELYARHKRAQSGKHAREGAR